jgi:alginate O-acetyltransferase complex protein AlgI
MVFASLIFVFWFLPVVLVGTLLVPARWRNLWLLMASLGFYAWGEGWYALVLVASILLNWGMGWAVAAAGGSRRRRLVAAGIVANLAGLVWFKYAGFAAANLAWLGVPDPGPIHLPIGISFFTFQGISYLVDIARGSVPAQRNLIDYGMYKALFPQLIAGPIVRYGEVAGDVGRGRRVTTADVAEGVRRFAIGLAKKMLIANVVSVPADAVFAAEGVSCGMAWFGVACYALQIYGDFSGYSDMAIGMGRMLGFHFPENFNHPYAAVSVQDFWRRWHMTLSRWFRDYVYIPLGGSRCGAWRHAGNLAAVFLLCGAWHGAAWTFVVWGAYHGALLGLEGSPAGRVLERLPRPLRHAWALVAVLVGWVLFRADTMTDAGRILAAMAGVGADAGGLWWSLATPDVLAALAVGIPLALGLPAWLRADAERRWGDTWSFHLSDAALTILLLVAGAVAAAIATCNPFIYFRF